MDTNRTKEQFFHVSRKVMLRNEKGETLILDCGNSLGSMSGFWDLPGGRIDRSETAIPLEKTIKREIFEEVGSIECTVNPKPVGAAIHIVPQEVHDLGEDLFVFMVLYEGEYLGGKIKISPVHAGYKWIDLNKIKPEEWFTKGLLAAVKNFLQK